MMEVISQSRVWKLFPSSKNWALRPSKEEVKGLLDEKAAKAFTF